MMFQAFLASGLAALILNLSQFHFLAKAGLIEDLRSQDSHPRAESAQ
jgi:hypothetical protein